MYGTGIKNKRLIVAIIVCFVIIIGVDLPLITNSLKGKEKDFNDKLFYVVASFEEKILHESAFMSTMDSDPAVIRIAKNNIRARIDSLFIANAIPINYDLAVGKMPNEDVALGEIGKMIKSFTENNLIWSSNPKNLKEIISTKVKVGYLGAIGKRVYYIKIFFPYKQQFLLRSLIPQFIIMSVTLIMLFVCFLILLSIVKKQNIIAKSKDDFISNMTHELKTPLFTISIASKILAEQDVIKGERKYLDYLRTIRDETTRLLNLADRVLETPEILSQAKMDIHEILCSATCRLELITRERNITMDVTLDAQQHLLEGHHGSLETAFVNILDNAIKYSSPGSRVLIKTSNEAANILVSITDFGTGFDPAIKDLIFEKFFRAHTGNIHDVKGYGIGLSFVKSVVDAHRGRIKVSSALGKGSTFVIILPSIKY